MAAFCLFAFGNTTVSSTSDNGPSRAAVPNPFETLAFPDNDGQRSN